MTQRKKKMLGRIAVGLMMFWAGVVSAMTPDGGVWWNPSESGSGYVIEIQNNVLSISVYSYDTVGNPFWYTSAGTMNGDNRYFGTLDRLSGGQCITCPYRAPSRFNAGTIELFFDTPTTATLTLNGVRTTRIQRTIYGIDATPPYPMFGEWAFVTGSVLFPVYFGDRMVFSQTTVSSGRTFASGYRTGASARTVVASKDTDGSWGILLDGSSSYWTLYTFSFVGVNTIQGTSWTFLKGAQASGSGLPFVAFRAGSAASVTTGNGPALPLLRELAPAIDDDLASRAKVDAQLAHPASGEAVEGVINARRVFEGLVQGLR